MCPKSETSPSSLYFADIGRPLCDAPRLPNLPPCLSLEIVLKVSFVTWCTFLLILSRGLGYEVIFTDINNNLQQESGKSFIYITVLYTLLGQTIEGKIFVNFALSVTLNTFKTSEKLNYFRAMCSFIRMFSSDIERQH